MALDYSRIYITFIYQAINRKIYPVKLLLFRQRMTLKAAPTRFVFSGNKYLHKYVMYHKWSYRIYCSGSMSRHLWGLGKRML